MPATNRKSLHRKTRPSAPPRRRSGRSCASSAELYHCQFGVFELSPGSPVARALGCSCPQHDGSEMFACDRECKVHGLDFLMSALDQTPGSAVEFDRT